MKLHIRAFALAFALWWGFGIFLITWWAIVLYGSTNELTFLGRFYLGYEVTPVGSVYGLVWGVINGLITGAIFAWLYNVILIWFLEDKPQGQGNESQHVSQ